MPPLTAHNSGSYCGNKIVEEGEDCDCGRPEECLEVDKCCVARDDALNIPGCTVRQGKQCRCVIPRIYDVTTSCLQIIIIIITTTTTIVIIIIIIAFFTLISTDVRIGCAQFLKSRAASNVEPEMSDPKGSSTKCQIFFSKQHNWYSTW